MNFVLGLIANMLHHFQSAFVRSPSCCLVINFINIGAEIIAQFNSSWTVRVTRHAAEYVSSMGRSGWWPNLAGDNNYAWAPR